MDARWSRIFYGNYNNDYTTFYDGPKVGAGIEIKNPVPAEAVITTPSLKDYIKVECKKRGLDYRVVYAVIEVESRWQADLVGDQGESFGLGQVQPKWHSDRMAKLGVTDLLNPYDNVLVMIDLLDELYDKYGNYENTLSVYNSGNTEDGRAYAERILSK